ncbi:MAG: SAM-dependent methyltransferase [Candidatus Kapaibacterium sp.]|nr:MAG: SAM-dependent methyltransferase [Candidatus Kapabacteria bacterium]
MPEVLIEPTCGLGAFIHAGLKHFSPLQHCIGVEIYPPYCAAIQSSVDAHYEAKVHIHCADIFTTNFASFLPINQAPTLILGNPPWATNSALQGQNLPEKSNIKQLSGMDALTGKSNFDIAEFITIKLLKECAGKNVVLALILKNSVIRNLLEAAPLLGLSISNAEAFTIDTKRYFGVDVAASLFLCRCFPSESSVQCAFQDFDNQNIQTKHIGWYGNGKSRFVADVKAYSDVAHLDGTSPFVWRQGIKHDAAAVMELTRTETGWVNNAGTVVKTEADMIFPLVKSTQAARSNGVITETPRAVIVPQRTIGADTDALALTQPCLYAYLQANEVVFAARKSSIYRNKPKFSIFGVGDYSFKLYKVAVSGLHKKPVFTLIFPIDGKPVMLDDTCYFLGFDTLEEAQRIHQAFQRPEVASFLAATAFLDAKRPFTKELLMRLDIGQLVATMNTP